MPLVSRLRPGKLKIEVKEGQKMKYVSNKWNMRYVYLMYIYISRINFIWSWLIIVSIFYWI